ncbi:MAG: hypothetical protein H6854_00385 [Rhodospirillales bacterium]|nr:hypothetical protein [Rhodospirillales bacterium]
MANEVSYTVGVGDGYKDDGCDMTFTARTSDVVQGKIVHDEGNVRTIQRAAGIENPDGQWGERTSLAVGLQVRGMQKTLGLEADGKITNELLDKLAQEGGDTNVINAFREMKESGVLDQVYNRSLSEDPMITVDCKSPQQYVPASDTATGFVPIDINLNEARAATPVAADAGAPNNPNNKLNELADRAVKLLTDAGVHPDFTTEGENVAASLMQVAATPEGAALFADVSDLQKAEVTDLEALVQKKMAADTEEPGLFDRAVSFAGDVVEDVREGVSGFVNESQTYLQDLSTRIQDGFANAVSGVLNSNNPEAAAAAAAADVTAAVQRTSSMAAMTA